jgi:hypothetical protein
MSKHVKVCALIGAIGIAACEQAPTSPFEGDGLALLSGLAAPGDVATNRDGQTRDRGETRSRERPDPTRPAREPEGERPGRTRPDTERGRGGQGQGNLEEMASAAIEEAIDLLGRIESGLGPDIRPAVAEALAEARGLIGEAIAAFEDGHFGLALGKANHAMAVLQGIVRAIA